MFQYNYLHYKDLFLRSDVPTAMLLKIHISWDVTLELLGAYLTGSKNTYCLHLQGQEVQEEKSRRKRCYMGTDYTGANCI